MSQTERLSASKFSLARQCVFPWVSALPWGVDTVESPVLKKTVAPWSSRLGTAVHGACETGKLDESNLTERQVEIAKGMHGQFRKWVAAYPSTWRHEIALYYDPETGDAGELTRTSHRDYSSAPSGAVCATIDLVSDGRFDFVDIKTGYSPDPPDKSDQMRLVGLMLGKIRKKPAVECGILVLRERDHTLMPATFSEMTLDPVESEVQRVHLAIKDRKGPTPGAHCRRCPLREVCPSSTATREMLKQLKEQKEAA